jgi:lysozyme
MSQLRLSDRGLALIAYFEAATSIKLSDGTTPYPGGYDEVPIKYRRVYMDTLAQPNVLTVGLGITTYDVPDLKEGVLYSEDATWNMFREHIIGYEQAVREAVRVKLNQNEFDALVSFTFNVGIGAFRDSTLLRKLNSGLRAKAADEFERWVYAGGQKLRGLEKRRIAERNLFLSPWKEVRKNVAQSRTVQAATVATIVSGTTALAPAIGPANEIAAFIRDNTTFALVALALISMYLVWVRYDDWRKGKR